jgi:phosphatidylcholine synthase
MARMLARAPGAGKRPPARCGVPLAAVSPYLGRMRTKPLAFAVHLLTGSGAALALMALIAATAGNWRQMFGWLVLALIVDGVDGPLARRVDIKRNAANWDGVLLDLVVDYLTYVFIPAYALIYSELIPWPWSLVAAIFIALTGVVYFADVRMKAEDNCFVGFPAVWQMPLLVFLTFQPPVWVTVVSIALMGVAQFTWLKFIHPVRTVRWRKANLSVCLLWVLFATWSVWDNFDPPQPVKLALLASSLWLLVVGVVMQAFPERKPAKSAG